MADRKAELERKKAKLEQMRAERKRKQEESQQDVSASGSSATPPPKDLRNETEELLKEIGIPLSSDTGLAQQKPAAAADSKPSDSSATLQESVYAAKKQAVLSFSKVTQTNLVPKDVVQYNKETQTPKETVEREDEDNESLEVGVDTPPPIPGSTKMPQTTMHKPTETPEDLVAGLTGPVVEEKPVPRELSEEERRKIVMSEDFLNFFSRASAVVERAMFEEVDIFADYFGTDDDDQRGGQLEGEQLKLNRQFFDERWSKHRTVTSLDWSTQFPELLLSSYNSNKDSPNEPEGVALVWNIKFKKTTPEFIFHCQSPVTSACFANFHPNLIVGGTYSGQIVLWDNRSHKHTPVQRTPLSALAVTHTHPVYCIDVVGSQNAHNLVSLSTDGKICFWSLDMLSQPQDSLELQYKQNRPVASWCCSFPYGDFNNYVVGCEDGAVYTACRHGSKSGISEIFESHQGPVTGVDCHAVPGAVDFSPYFLTSSFDWTVKLWNMKENRLLHSFEDNSDYIFDVKWSPTHPALFSTVDGSGRLDLWNLNIETEVPAASVVVENNAGLNRCRWHQAGHTIAAGDDSGKIHIYEVGEPLAVPRSDDWSKFSHTLQELKLEQVEQEEENSSMLSQSPMR